MPTTPGNLKKTCVHLGDKDREAIKCIRECLELDSDALAIRTAIRSLAKRLSKAEGAKRKTTQ